MTHQKKTIKKTKSKKEKSTIHNNISIKIGDSSTKKPKRKRTTKKKGDVKPHQSGAYDPNSPFTSIQNSINPNLNQLIMSIQVH